MNELQENRVDISKVALLFAGPPASGKSFLVDGIKNVFGFVEINPDTFKEKIGSTEQRANELVIKHTKNLTTSGKGIIVNLTGRSKELYTTIAEQLEQVGYYVIMIFLWLDDENIAVRRSLQRERKTDYDYLISAIKDVNKNFVFYKKFFSRNNKRDMFVFNAFTDGDDAAYEQQYGKLVNDIRISINNIKTKQPENKSKLRKFLDYVGEAAPSTEVKYETCVMMDEVRDIKEVVAILERDCPEVLDTYIKTGEVLYRGTRESVSKRATFLKCSSPQNRPPMTLNRKINAVVDDVLQYSFDAKAIRSNSTFCTSSYSDASSYGGDTRVILPLKTTDITYLTTPDLYSFVANMTNYEKNGEIFPGLKEYGSKYIKGTGNTFFVMAERGFANIFMTDEEEEKYYRVDLDKFEQYLNPKYQTGISNFGEFILPALRNKYEVYLHGEYYSLNGDWWYRVMRYVNSADYKNKQDQPEEIHEEDEAGIKWEKLTTLAQKADIYNTDDKNRVYDLMYDTLMKDCPELMRYYIKLFKDKATPPFLYRGSIYYRHKILIQGTSPTDRKPLSMSVLMNNAVDRVLSAIGCVALRGNSIFATCDEHGAMGYANHESAHAIFPIEGKSDITAIESYDLYQSLGSIMGTFDMNIGAKKKEGIILFPELAKIYEVMKTSEANSSYHEIGHPGDLSGNDAKVNKYLTKLFDFLNNKPKVYPKYVGASYEEFVQMILTIDPQAFFKLFSPIINIPKDTTLVNEMPKLDRNQPEVYIHGAYYIVDKYYFDEMLRYKLNNVEVKDEN